MNEAALLQHYLIVGALLFAIGLVGLTARRNLIVMFLATELMLQGISISLVAWSRFHNDWGGQMLVIFIIAVAACEAAIALALVVALFQSAGSLDVAYWHRLREDNLPEYVDKEIPAPPEEEEAWPELTPAGQPPDVDPTKTPYRTHV
jgi:NADH-quinone oxidoreductase subunit K